MIRKYIKMVEAQRREGYTGEISMKTKMLVAGIILADKDIDKKRRSEDRLKK